MSERAHPILYVIATLLAVNLLLTIWLVALPRPNGSPAASKALPSGLTSLERDRLFAQAQERYNADDGAGIHALFDEFARSQIDEEEVVNQVHQLNVALGAIQSGQYSHYEFAGSQGERDFFRLLFNVKLASPQFPTGRATLTITSIGDHYGLVGFHLHAGAIP